MTEVISLARLVLSAGRRAPKSPSQDREGRRVSRHYSEKESFQCAHQTRALRFSAPPARAIYRDL